MAGEGLFFTGQVLKNNRNLLQEEAVREQLRLRREQLDLQKQRIADQRAEARRRREKPKDYSFESIDNRFVPSFSNRILNLRSLAGEDPDNSNLINEETLNIDAEQQVLKGVTSQYQSLVELSRQGKDEKFTRNDQGGYVYEDNLNAISEGYANGQNLNDLMLMYPLNYDDIADVTKFQNPIGSRVSDFIKDQKVLPEINNFKIPFSGGIQEKTKSFIIQNSTPNPDGSFDDPNFEMMMVGGQNVDFINSGPADPRFMFGISKGYSDVGESFYNKINPKSGEGVYDPELYKEYQDFFVDEMIKLEKAKNPSIAITPKPKKTDKEIGLSQEDINLLTSPSTEIESFGDVQVKADPNFIDDVVGNKLTVGLKPSYLIKGQGDKQNTFETLYKEQVKGSNKPVTGNVTRVGLTTGNVPVAAVSFDAVEVLIPASRLSSVSEKLKENAKAYKIYQYGEYQGSSSQGVGSKYNKQ